MDAEIVAIGSELLLGQIVDTNSAWMAQELASLGVNLHYKTVVGDNPQRMEEVLAQAILRSDVVITCGGIGPTQDDLTREIVAKTTGNELVQEQRLLDQLLERYQARGILITPNNARQAYIPMGALILANPNGTAPAFIVEDIRAAVICLPGVPFEMKWLFVNSVMPYLKQRFQLEEVITSRVLKVAGLGESAVDHRIGHLIASMSNPTVGVLAHPGQVDVRITAKSTNTQAALELIAPVEKELDQLLGRTIFARDSETMEDVIGEILENQELTIAVYEDLTAGTVSQRIAEAAGDRFIGGIIGNGISSIRDVLPQELKNHQMAYLLRDRSLLTPELARSVKDKSGADLGLAVHGNPEGDALVENLAAGKTFISVAREGSINNGVHNFAGRGLPDRTRASLAALDLLRTTLLAET